MFVRMFVRILMAAWVFSLFCAAQNSAVDHTVTLARKKVKGGPTEYADNEFRVKFALPAKWSLASQSRFEDTTTGEAATTLSFHDPGLDTPVSLYYRLLRGQAADEPIDQLLQVEIEKKVGLRARQGLQHYQIKAESCEKREVHGQRALRCVGEYTEGGRPMSEYLVWVRSRRCLAQFFVHTRSGKMVSLRASLEDAIQSLDIP